MQTYKSEQNLTLEQAESLFKHVTSNEKNKYADRARIKRSDDGNEERFYVEVSDLTFLEKKDIKNKFADYKKTMPNNMDEPAPEEKYVRSEETQDELEHLSKLAGEKGMSVEDEEDGTFNLYNDGGDPVANMTREEAEEYLGIDIDGMEDEVTEMVKPYIHKLVDAVLAKTGGNAMSAEDIKGFEVDVLTYTADINISVHSHRGTSQNVANGYDAVAKILGQEKTDEIKEWIDNKKEDIKKKNKEGYGEKHPYTAISEIKILWAEAGDGVKSFDSIEDLEKHYKSFYVTGDYPAYDEGYDKSKIRICLVNDKLEQVNLEPRIDVGSQSGDWLPSKQSLLDYLTNDMGYNIDTDRDFVNKLKFRVDMGDGVVDSRWNTQTRYLTDSNCIRDMKVGESLNHSDYFDNTHSEKYTFTKLENGHILCYNHEENKLHDYEDYASVMIDFVHMGVEYGDPLATKPDTNAETGDISVDDVRANNAKKRAENSSKTTPDNTPKNTLF